MADRRRIAARIMALAIVAGCAARASAGERHEEHKSIFERIEERKAERLKGAQATPHTYEQAGYPFDVSRIARPSYNDHYDGGWVGGGKPHGGRGFCPHEGTWGWDYTIHPAFSQRIFMNMSKDRAYQGGHGRYKTDGPHPLHAITEAVHGHGEAGEAGPPEH